MIRGPRAVLIGAKLNSCMSEQHNDAHKALQNRDPRRGGSPGLHHLEYVWQGRHERRLFSVATRGSQCLQCLERGFDQITSRLVLYDVPDEADEINDRCSTLLAQLFGDEWNFGGNDAKCPRFDLVQVPSVHVHKTREPIKDKRTFVSSDVNITRLAVKNSLAVMAFMMRSPAA